jgi:hypothetical protein
MASLARVSRALIFLLVLQCFCDIAVAERGLQYGKRNLRAGNVSQTHSPIHTITFNTSKHLTRRTPSYPILIPRNTNSTALPFGPGLSLAARVTGGPIIQEIDFVDGLEFCIQSDQPMTFNVEMEEGINPGTLPDNTTALNTFSWVVSTSAPLKLVNAQMFVPCKFSLLF